MGLWQVGGVVAAVDVVSGLGEVVLVDSYVRALSDEVDSLTYSAPGLG